ncbi:MAG: BlaI/MecI/CopY family transcriptional regulator [Thermoguttaceae bacterium]|jgi:predicted transcriptional regulator
MEKMVSPTERELEILKILWQKDRATVRQVWRKLSGENKELSYTTVLSLLQTMEKKGLVGHEAAGKAYNYFPEASRGETVRMLAGRFLEKVFDGAMDEYLVHALDWRNVSLEELDRLEAMIVEAKKKRQSSQPPHEKGDKP